MNRNIHSLMNMLFLLAILVRITKATKQVPFSGLKKADEIDRTGNAGAVIVSKNEEDLIEEEADQLLQTGLERDLVIDKPYTKTINIPKPKPNNTGIPFANLSRVDEHERHGQARKKIIQQDKIETAEIQREADELLKTGLARKIMIDKPYTTNKKRLVV